MAIRRKSMMAKDSRVSIMSKYSDKSIDEHDAKKYSDEAPWLLRIYWAVFKSHLFCLTMFSLIMFVVLMMAIAYISNTGESAFIHRAKTQNRRNYSALVPVWGIIEKGQLGQWDFPFVIDFVGLSLLYAILGLVGLVTYFSIMRYRDGTIIMFLALYAILNLCTIFAEAHLLLTHSDFDNSAYRMAKAKMHTVINQEYRITSEDSFTQAFNLIMISGRCCGIDGPDDFSYNNLTVILTADMADTYKYAPKLKPWSFYWPKNGRNVTLKIPPVCCKDEYFTGGTLEDQFDRQIKCATKGYSEVDAYLVGCGKVYHDMMLKSYANTLIIYLTLMVYLKVSVSLMCIVRILQHFDKTLDIRK